MTVHGFVVSFRLIVLFDSWSSFFLYSFFVSEFQSQATSVVQSISITKASELTMMVNPKPGFKLQVFSLFVTLLRNQKSNTFLDCLH